MYHGWGDPGANPIRSIRYRDSVVRFLEASRGTAHGRKRVKGETWKGEKETDKFLKLYLVPGMAHCGGGTGHSSVDWLTPLVDWVEHGVAPEAIVGSRGASTRPHCPYPQEAVYDGAGDRDSAASYICTTLD
jgi:feruloyl esterase